MPAGTNPGSFCAGTGTVGTGCSKWGARTPEACPRSRRPMCCSRGWTNNVCVRCVAVTVYDCDYLSEGDCDCDGNVVGYARCVWRDVEADEDGDGICDDGDSCVGINSACNGPGANFFPDGGVRQRATALERRTSGVSLARNGRRGLRWVWDDVDDCVGNSRGVQRSGSGVGARWNDASGGLL